MTWENVSHLAICLSWAQGGLLSPSLLFVLDAAICVTLEARVKTKSHAQNAQLPQQAFDHARLEQLRTQIAHAGLDGFHKMHDECFEKKPGEDHGQDWDQHFIRLFVDGCLAQSIDLGLRAKSHPRRSANSMVAGAPEAVLLDRQIVGDTSQMREHSKNLNRSVTDMTKLLIIVANHEKQTTIPKKQGLHQSSKVFMQLYQHCMEAQSSKQGPSGSWPTEGASAHPVYSALRILGSTNSSEILPTAPQMAERIETATEASQENPVLSRLDCPTSPFNGFDTSERDNASPQLASAQNGTSTGVVPSRLHRIVTGAGGLPFWRPTQGLGQSSANVNPTISGSLDGQESFPGYLGPQSALSDASTGVNYYSYTPQSSSAAQNSPFSPMYDVGTSSHSSVSQRTSPLFAMHSAMAFPASESSLTTSQYPGQLPGPSFQTSQWTQSPTQGSPAGGARQRHQRRRGHSFSSNSRLMSRNPSNHSTGSANSANRLYETPRSEFIRPPMQGVLSHRSEGISRRRASYLGPVVGSPSIQQDQQVHVASSPSLPADVLALGSAASTEDQPRNYLNGSRVVGLDLAGDTAPPRSQPQLFMGSRSGPSNLAQQTPLPVSHTPYDTQSWPPPFPEQVLGFSPMNQPQVMDDTQHAIESNAAAVMNSADLDLFDEALFDFQMGANPDV